MPVSDKRPQFREDEHIVEDKNLTIAQALIPVFALVGMLAYNVYVFGDDAISGSTRYLGYRPRRGSAP